MTWRRDASWRLAIGWSKNTMLLSHLSITIFVLSDLHRAILKVQENIGFALTYGKCKKTQVLRENFGKRIENIGFAQEPMEN